MFVCCVEYSFFVFDVALKMWKLWKCSSDFCFLDYSVNGQLSWVLVTMVLSLSSPIQYLLLVMFRIQFFRLPCTLYCLWGSFCGVKLFTG